LVDLAGIGYELRLASRMQVMTRIILDDAKLPTVQRQDNMDSGAENGHISTPVPKPAQF
jgi:hypothetical protein